MSQRPVAPPFESVLVANRGEIALRVIRTARRVGLRTVALFTDLDADAPHVRAADEAYEVASYLDVEAVVGAARTAGAEAVHPGYGFLSENADFARAVVAAGLVLVGPTPEVMDAMGRKDAAREIAVAAGVPVVPAYDALGFEARSQRTSTTGPPSTDGPDEAGGVDFPVLVKAAAGGGGKGMRVVRSGEEYADALGAAQREARSSFGDDTMLIEKYVERGRHIEVQVFGDTLGHVVHLFERDCSVQRRHQKVLEEAPAPTITEEVRRLVCESAVRLAAHVDYTGAGTVEFLVDVDATHAEGGEALGGDPGGVPPGVYFLEMNTRLQVEHPVTEAVVRVRGEVVDLVELQLRVAAGEELGFDQADVTVEGHAIEARVYAEDAFAGFLPQAGTTSLVRWPTGPEVRVDHALESDQVVSTSYDPMLGKVIASGPDREEARTRLVAALGETAILGLTTNVGFLRDLAASPAFEHAEIDTAWLDRETLAPPDEADRDTARIHVAWVQAMLTAGDTGHPFAPDGFRIGADPAPQLVELDRDVLVDRSPNGRTGRVDVGDGWVGVRLFGAQNHVLDLSTEGRRDRVVANVQPPPAAVAEAVLHGQRHVFTPPDRLAGTVAVGDGTVSAPMPGTLLDVRVEAGQRVAEGDVLATMEAMKMELALKAPFDGVVEAVDVRAGDQVALGARLLLVSGDPA